MNSMKKTLLFIMFIATANITFADDAINLTSNGGLYPDAVWTPEGEKIAYSSNLIDSDIHEIYIMNSDGSNQTQVTYLNGYAGGASWSPDGSRIVFAKSDEAIQNPNIFVIEVDGSNLEQLTFSGDDWRPDWSHDGSTIIFERNWGSASLMAINPDGSDLRVMTYDDGSSIIGGAFQWSPDDQSIVFEEDDYIVGDPDYPDYPRDIYVYTVHVDGTELTRIIQRGYHPSWSPDGTKIAYVHYDKNDIYIYDLETSTSQHLTDDPARDDYPEWAHDGASIYFTSVRTGNWEIFVIDSGIESTDPILLITALIKDIIDDPDIDGGLENSLTKKLYNTLSKLNSDNEKIALRQMNNFIKQVNGKQVKKLSIDDADRLITSAQKIVALIGGSIAKPAFTQKLPESFVLSQNSPNPFNPVTTISYSIPDGISEYITLKVYDLRGALVRTLVDQFSNPGIYSVMWDGNDNNGHKVSSGIYIYTLQASEFKKSNKMMLMR